MPTLEIGGEGKERGVESGRERKGRMGKRGMLTLMGAGGVWWGFQG